MVFNRDYLSQILQQLNLPPQIMVAYSGGLDSHALLYALVELRNLNPGLSLRAVHIDHGLSARSVEWSAHCVRVCQQLAIECIIKKIQVIAAEDSLEEVARNLRYAAFAEIMMPGECLVTAHTVDDQAETVLLQLLRGAGIPGLAAMPVVKPLGPGKLARPLLSISRAALHTFACEKQLRWIEDESNLNTNFDRNFIRHQVLPILRKRWPSTAKVIARTARHCAEANDLLAELATSAIPAEALFPDGSCRAGNPPCSHTARGVVAPRVTRRPKYYRAEIADSILGGRRGNFALTISCLQSFDPSQQKNVLRVWLRSQQFRVPSEVKLHQLQQDFLHSKASATPYMQWAGVEVRRFKDNLYAMPPLSAHDPGIILTWDLHQPLALPSGIGVLQPHMLAAEGVDLSNGSLVTIRFRQGGERFKPAGRFGSHPLKKLFQEWQVPPWLRDRIPLIYLEGHLVAVIWRPFIRDVE